ncbi:MAG TPA: hypothetical protein VFH31_01190 [Pyrinomonadaceae bacterium]|nr:hypothetical protein [Pyrinomonadaceae bacterium]
MKILNILLLMFGLATIGASQTVESPKPETAIPGTRVSLVPPAGFTPAAQFSGFWQESLGSSIMVTEFPGPLSEVSSGFLNPSDLAKRGMALLNKLEVKVNNETGLLLNLKQNAFGTEYRKWLLIFGDEKESVMLAATFPKELEGDLSEKMKASILTVKWDRERKVAPTEGLNFTFTEKGEIKLAKRIANSLLYTKSGIFPSKAVDDPLFIIGQTLSKLDIDDKEQFAKSRLSQTATITEIEIERLSQVTVDNLSGYEILAKGNDTESGNSMVVYQVVLYEDRSYYIMQGLVSAKHGQTYLPVFKEMARSFRRKK